MTVNPIDETWGSRPVSFLTSCQLFLAGSAVTRRVFKRHMRNLFMRRGAIIDVMIDGIRVRCHLGDNKSECDLAEGRSGNLGKLGDLISGLEAGGTFVDIGANFGLFSLFAARAVGPCGTVLAIEPSPVMASRVHFNAVANGFTQIVVLKTAVGERSGFIDLHETETQRGRTSIIPSRGSVSRPVPVSTLFDVATEAGLSCINAMKIDIEGYEDRALVPFFEAAPRSLWPKRILIEHCHNHVWEMDALAFMRAVGYRFDWQGPRDTLLTLV